MAARTPTVTNVGQISDLGDALDIVAAAAAMGLPVSAPVGTTVFVAQSATSDGRWFIVGLHSTETAAKRALAQHLILLWRTSEISVAYLPWISMARARGAFAPGVGGQPAPRLRNGDEERFLRDWLVDQPSLDALLNNLRAVHTTNRIALADWRVLELAVQGDTSDPLAGDIAP